MGKGKDAPEKIQGFWIIEIPELAGIRKTDVNNVKAFLSRSDDNYRASYGHTTESHPRQCIIVGSTNSERAGFLRDVTGNRRFWPVRVSGKNARLGWDITDEDVLQIWAEAKLIWNNGEKLYLEGDDAEAAVSEQADAMESDEREGLVREYLICSCRRTGIRLMFIAGVTISVIRMTQPGRQVLNGAILLAILRSGASA